MNRWRRLIGSWLAAPVFRQGGVVLLDQGFLSLANFLTGVLVARACSREDYGAYVLAWSLLLVALSAYRALVHVPFTVLLPRLNPADQSAYQGSALAHTALIGVGFALAIAAFQLGPAAGLEGKLAPLLPVAGLVAAMVIPVMIREFVRNALFARLSFFASVLVNALATVAQLSAVGLLFLTGALSLRATLLIMLVTSAVAATAMLWVHAGQMAVQPRRWLADFARGWHISRWVSLNVLGMIGASQAYLWLLLFFEDATDVAVFGAALAVAGVMAPFLQAANAYVLPRMSHGYRGTDIATLIRMTRRAMLGLLIPYGGWAIAGSAFADQLLTMVYSTRYSGHAAVVVLLLFRTLFEGLSAPLTSALQALEKPQVTTQALLLGTTVTFTVGLAATARFGLVGAAAAALLTSLVMTSYKLVRLRGICLAQLRQTAAP